MFEEIKKKLKEFEIFKQIDDDRLEQLCSNTQIVLLEENDILIKKGEPCHKGLYFVYDGEIFVENPDTQISYTVGKGGIVGITAFTGKTSYAVNATCSKESELIFIPDI